MLWWDKMNKTKKITYTAVLTALLFVLSAIEAMLPLTAFLPMGVKIGLANIAVMYAIFFIDKKSGIYMAICKGIFAFVSRGLIASLLSAAGSLLSVVVVIFLISVFREKISYIAISVISAVSHNIGQLIALSFILSGAYIYYLPVLIISGVFMGIITGMVLRAVMPAISNVLKK